MPTKTQTKTKSPTPKRKEKKPAFIRAVGRRKTSVARVRLYEGQGDNLINDLSVTDYFPGAVNQTTFLAPLKSVNAVGKFYVTVKVVGGGIRSQVQAVSHGIARALVKYDESLRANLKSKGLLTRDSRMKERRKAGYAQSARARKQSPKR